MFGRPRTRAAGVVRNSVESGKAHCTLQSKKIHPAFVTWVGSGLGAPQEFLLAASVRCCRAVHSEDVTRSDAERRRVPQEGVVRSRVAAVQHVAQAVGSYAAQAGSVEPADAAPLLVFPKQAHALHYAQPWGCWDEEPAHCRIAARSPAQVAAEHCCSDATRWHSRYSRARWTDLRCPLEGAEHFRCNVADSG